MTREEAIARIKDHMVHHGIGRYPHIMLADALDMAIAALRHQIWEEQLWHDAKTDPPKTPGLYYGKKDDTNSMYACQYRDGVWVLDMYRQQKMDIVQWADYTAFVREDEETALTPPTQEQMERVWRSTWTMIGADKRGRGGIFKCIKCERCYPVKCDFCPNCGRAMTPAAWEELRKRLEAVYETEN